MSNPAVSDIITLARHLMREDSGSDLPVIQDDFLIECVAEADREIFRAYNIGGGNAPVANALETGFTLASDTAVNDPNGVTTASVTVTVDSTAGYDPAGMACFWDKDMPDLFSYTGTTPTSFTGVTGISYAHADDIAIQALYGLPANFGQFRRSEQYGDGCQINGEPLIFMEGPALSEHFSMRDNGTTKFLWLPRGSSGVASVWFDRDSDTINSTDDLVSFGQDFKFFYAWRTIYLALFGRGDYEIIPLADAQAKRIKLDIMKDRNVGRMLRVRQYQGFPNPDSSLARRENAL